jgi:hypothetical protein
MPRDFSEIIEPLDRQLPRQARDGDFPEKEILRLLSCREPVP